MSHLKKSIAGQVKVNANLAGDLKAMAKNTVKAMDSGLIRLLFLHSQFPLTVPTWNCRKALCKNRYNHQIRLCDNSGSRPCVAMKHPDSIVTEIIIEISQNKILVCLKYQFLADFLYKFTCRNWSTSREKVLISTTNRDKNNV